MGLRHLAATHIPSEGLFEIPFCWKLDDRDARPKHIFAKILTGIYDTEDVNMDVKMLVLTGR